MIKPFLVLCFLAVACLCGCSKMFSKPSRLSASAGTPGTPPARGILVTKVFPESAAAAAGIQSMDLITQYGEREIVNNAAFFAARSDYEDAFATTVEIVVWRGGLRMAAVVPTDRLGVSTSENDEVSQLFSSLMNRISAERELPDYKLHLANGQFNEGPAKILKEAKALIDRAEREGKLTSEQVQVARIYMILDEAPVKDQQRQAELLKELFATQPVSYIRILGTDKFFVDGRYRAAIGCFNHYLKAEPDNVRMRLDLATAYNQVGMYDQAESAANYVFDHNPVLTEHSKLIGYQAEMIATMGRKEYRKSIEFAEKALAIHQDHYGLMFVQLAAAQMGDTARLEEAIQRLKQVQPEKYLEFKLQIDAVHAYAMVNNNQRDAARKLVRQWEDTDEAAGKLVGFWGNLPYGTDVAYNWAELMED